MAKRRSRVRKTNTKNWGQKGKSVAMPATIAIPSGKCPFTAEDVSEDSILEWIALLTSHKAPAVTYRDTVYTYWIRHSFDVNSSEYRTAKEIILRYVPEYVKKMEDLRFNASELVG